MEYTCTLPMPLKAQVKVNGTYQHQDINILYFKEPSISQLKCDFRYTRNAFKKLQQSMSAEIKQAQDNQKEEVEEEAEEKAGEKVLTEQEALKRGYPLLEMIDNADVDIYQKPLEEAFKVYLTKGSCFLAPSMDAENKLTKTHIDTLDYDNFQAIFAVYLGFFLYFFILKNPEKMKELIA